MHLRALEPEDLDLLYQLENDEQLWPCGSHTAPYSRYALQQYIVTNQNDFYLDGQLRLVVCQEDKPIGLVDLFDYDRKHHRAEVGIALLPPYRHRGMGTAALQSLERYVHTHLSLHQLYAVVSTDNHAAQSSFAHAGYTSTLTLRDWIAMPNGCFQDALLFQLIL